MAEQLVKLTDLKQAFSHFQDLSDLVGRINGEIADVNTRNLTAAGSDSIGQQYHQQVDQPTQDLTDLVKQIQDKLQDIGIQGSDAADLIDAADEDATATALS